MYYIYIVCVWMMYVLTCMYVSIFRTQRKQSPNTLHVQFVHWLRCLIRNYGSDYIVGFNVCICCICVCSDVYV